MYRFLTKCILYYYNGQNHLVFLDIKPQLELKLQFIELEASTIWRFMFILYSICNFVRKVVSDDRQNSLHNVLFLQH